MNRLIAICIVANYILSAAPVMAVYTVDLGTIASETQPGISLAEWGPIQPTTSSGNWGGMGSGTAPGSLDQLCRTVWGHTIGGLTWAAITFPTPITSVDIRHLDGIADDSFSVNILPGGASWGSYTWSGNTTEFWVTTTFSGPSGNKLMITATGAQWPSFGTYGQLGIDWINAVPIPAPSAILLGGIGIGLVGWLRRRRTL